MIRDIIDAAKDAMVFGVFVAFFFASLASVIAGMIVAIQFLTSI
ncbi:hypothetical protein [Microcystis phage Mwe-JY13]